MIQHCHVGVVCCSSIAWARVLALGCVLAASTALAQAPKAGDKVWAQWRPNMFYHGSVTRAVGSGFHVAFDDGDEAVLAPGLIAVDKAPAAAAAKVGGRVVAKWTDGNFYPGAIVKTEDGSFDVDFDDGDVLTVGLDDLRLLTPRLDKGRAAKVGDKVWAQWKPNAWYHGEATKAVAHGLNVAFDDGDRAELALGLIAVDKAPAKGDVTPGSRVLAPFGGDLYPGTVASIAGGVYKVSFDDGDEGESGLEDLRLLNQ